MTKVEFNTNVFEFSHGTKPRGKGCWAFFMGNDRKTPVFFNGSYAECKKAAADHAKAKGETVVVVAP